MVPHLLSGAGLSLYELGNYPEARVVLERSLHENANELAQAWVLVVLGRTATAMAEYAPAQDYIDQALKMSWAVRQLPEVLDALVALSELRIKKGHMADAAVTLHLVASHSATTGYSRALAQRLLRSLAGSSSTTAHSDIFGEQTLLEEVVMKVVS